MPRMSGTLLGGTDLFFNLTDLGFYFFAPIFASCKALRSYEICDLGFSLVKLVLK